MLFSCETDMRGQAQYERAFHADKRQENIEGEDELLHSKSRITVNTHNFF